MKKFFKIILVLAVVCFISGLVLSFVYNGLKDRISANEAAAKNAAVRKIFPGSKLKKKKSSSGEIYWKVPGKGYAFEARGMGFQDELIAVVGTDVQLEKIKGVAILKCLDTPGMGGEMTKKYFLARFVGVTPPAEVVKAPAKNSSQVQAITGATISSKAIVSIINRKMLEMRKELGK